jgi:outer membrane protein TolC
LRDTLELRRTWLEAESKQAAAIADQWTAIADLLLTCGWSDLPQDSIRTTPASPTR